MSLWDNHKVSWLLPLGLSDDLHFWGAKRCKLFVYTSYPSAPPESGEENVDKCHRQGRFSTVTRIRSTYHVFYSLFTSISPIRSTLDHQQTDQKYYVTTMANISVGLESVWSRFVGVTEVLDWNEPLKTSKQFIDKQAKSMFSFFSHYCL